MNTKRTTQDKVWLIFKGIAMGTANKVPGVSGGLVAFVAGFYEEFIYSLQKINKTALTLVLKGRLKSFIQYTNAGFLSLLCLGMCISYFSVSKILDYLLLEYELQVWSTFFGMIIGSILYITKNFGVWNRRYIGYLICGIIAGIAISFLEPARENDNLLFVFLCGIIGVSGMTLPGLSGSFILIILGNYVLLLVDAVNALFDTLSELVVGDFSFKYNHQRVRLLKVLVVFSLGSVTGLVSLSQLLGFVLKKYKKATYAVIIGFISGSLGVVWPWKEKIYSRNALGDINLDANAREIITGYHRYFPTEVSWTTVFALFFILLGIFGVLSINWYHIYKKQTNG